MNKINQRLKLIILLNNQKILKRIKQMKIFSKKKQMMIFAIIVVIMAIF
jgi:hypothetical protein